MEDKYKLFSITTLIERNIQQNPGSNGFIPRFLKKALDDKN